MNVFEIFTIFSVIGKLWGNTYKKMRMEENNAELEADSPRLMDLGRVSVSVWQASHPCIDAVLVALVQKLHLVVSASCGK